MKDWIKKQDFGDVIGGLLCMIILGGGAVTLFLCALIWNGTDTYIELQTYQTDEHIKLLQAENDTRTTHAMIAFCEKYPDNCSRKSFSERIETITTTERDEAAQIDVTGEN